MIVCSGFREEQILVPDTRMRMETDSALVKERGDGTGSAGDSECLQVIHVESGILGSLFLWEV
jgi:hypothetical protein